MIELDTSHAKNSESAGSEPSLKAPLETDADLVYFELLQHILRHGDERGDRTGTGTFSVFGYQMRFDLSRSFPLLTTKKVHVPSVVHELLWFLSGETNTSYLQQNKVRIWNEWATEDGDLGPVYGKQWRAWQKPDGTTIDQVAMVIDQIKKNPRSRRLIINAWNVADLPIESKSPQDNVREGRMALAPCHAFIQFYVSSDNRLSCQLYQRSCDVFLGLPFNIASYSLLTHMIANQTGLKAGEFIWSGGDVHIYRNHLQQVQEQLARSPRPKPTLVIKRTPDSIFDFTANDFEFVGYDPHPPIKAPISV